MKEGLFKGEKGVEKLKKSGFWEQVWLSVEENEFLPGEVEMKIKRWWEWVGQREELAKSEEWGGVEYRRVCLVTLNEWLKMEVSGGISHEFMEYLRYLGEASEYNLESQEQIFKYQKWQKRNQVTMKKSSEGFVELAAGD